MNLSYELIKSLPKCELHLHIEGSLEPELLLKLAEENCINLPYQSIDEIKEVYNFNNLQSFLDIYYLGASVLVKESDFYQLMMAYFNKCLEDNIVHTEIMFDPQTHTDRGIEFSTFMAGFNKARNEARQKYGISSKLIMSFLRHLSEESALETLEQARPWSDDIELIGLDSSEVGNPPTKFINAFAAAREQGYIPVAHAGEEGDADYIWQALNLLKVTRIDHGVRCSEDDILVDYLVEHQIPLTVCPFSNVKLCVFDKLADHNIRSLLHRGLVVTVNSDDPSYFGGYLNDNFKGLVEECGLTNEELIQLV